MEFRVFLEKYRVEVITSCICLFSGMISVGLFLYSYSHKPAPVKTTIKKIVDCPKVVSKEVVKAKIFVHIDGSVVRPDVYELEVGSRLKDVFKFARGLSPEADRVFFFRNYNLAHILTDQEKIYVPSIEEVKQGESIEQIIADSSPNINDSYFININTASEDDIDKLSGVGPVTAKKLIDNRPYDSIEQLVERKVFSQKLYDDLVDLLRVE